MTEQDKASLKVGDRVRYVSGGPGGKVERADFVGKIVLASEGGIAMRAIAWPDGQTLDLWVTHAADIVRS